MRKQSHQSQRARRGLHSVPAHPTLKLQLYTASLNNIQNDKWHYKPDIHHQSFFKEHPSSIMHVWIMWNQELPDSFTQPPASRCCLNDTCQPVCPNCQTWKKKKGGGKKRNEERLRKNTGGENLQEAEQGNSAANVKAHKLLSEGAMPPAQAGAPIPAPCRCSRPGHIQKRWSQSCPCPPALWQGPVINDTCHSVGREGWVSDVWLCWKGNRLFGMARLFSTRI